MRAHELRSPAGTTRRSRRLGRGTAAGQGKTAGRGTKGQGARSGGTKGPYFEGGQLPFVRRLPFRRGFTNIHKERYAPVNVEDLNREFSDGDVVTLERLKAAGLIRSTAARVKVLGNGTLAKKLTVHAHAFSATARDKIGQAGGQVEDVG